MERDKAAVERFLLESVSIYGEDPHADLNPCLLALEACLDRLPEDIVIRLMENTVVHIPGGRPAVLRIHEPMNIVILPDSMVSWSFEARVGAIAHEFAHIVCGNDDDNQANDLARRWGFEEEVKASLDMLLDITLAQLGAIEPEGVLAASL